MQDNQGASKELGYQSSLFWFVCPNIWSSSWENLFLPYANNKGAHQPVHPHSLISAFVVRCLDSVYLSFSFYTWNFKHIPSFCGCAGRLESTLVANPEDRFSRDRAPLWSWWYQHCRLVEFLRAGEKLNEPPHDKTNKIACAPSEDSDQPGHLPSLISLCCPHEESSGP